MRANDLASLSDLFVFSDGAKGGADSERVQQVRRYIHTIEGFRSVSIVERESNWGVDRSVIGGVTRLCEEFGFAINLEDDLLTSPDFLTFMNDALRHYETQAGIFSVSGFNFGLEPPAQGGHDAFLFYRVSSWGWGTWKDRWDKVDWRVSDYENFRGSPEQQSRFSRGGEDLPRMLELRMRGKLESWDIVWEYTHFRHNALGALPVHSRVFNFGNDGSGIHKRQGALKQSPLASELKTAFVFPPAGGVEAHFMAELLPQFRASPGKKIARYLYDKVR